jgi:hypothetical protein
MAEDFDSRAAANDLAQLVSSTSAEVRQALPPATPAPLFHKLQDGSVTDRKGNVILPAPKPAEHKP